MGGRAVGRAWGAGRWVGCGGQGSGEGMGGQGSGEDVGGRAVGRDMGGRAWRAGLTATGLLPARAAALATRDVATSLL